MGDVEFVFHLILLILWYGWELFQYHPYFLFFYNDT